MQTLQERVKADNRKLLRPGGRVAVAVSGGADSVFLLRLLLELRGELGIVLHVAHLNHGIRGAESDADEKFVRELAAEHSLADVAHFASVNTPEYAATTRQSLETAARELRYKFFRELLERGVVDKIATAHTADD